MLEDMFVKWVIPEEGQKLLTAPKYWVKVSGSISMVMDGYYCSSVRRS